MGYSSKVVKTIEQFVDLVDIGTDDIPNSEQKGAFVSEGAEAVMALLSLASELPKSEYDEALEMLGLALVGKTAENKVKHSDGSGYSVYISALEGPAVELPDDEADIEIPEGEDHSAPA